MPLTISQPSFIQKILPESSTIQTHVNHLTSAISNCCSFILTPEEIPTWNKALLKTCMGITSRAAIDSYKITGFGNYNDYANLAGECLSTGLAMTGIREICYLAYTKLAYQTVDENTFKKNRLKAVTLSEKNANLSKLIKTIKLVTISGMSLHCLYNYNYLGNFHLLSDNPSSAQYSKFYSLHNLPYLTSSELQLAQIGVCALSILMNFKQLKNIQEEDFLKDSPLSEIVNTFACATFFSQLNAVSIEAQNWYQCMLPNVKSCFQKRLRDPSKTCQTGTYEKCMNLLPAGQLGAKTAKKYLESINRYWLLEKYNLGKVQKIKPGHLQLHHFQSWTQEYGLAIQLKNIFSLLKKNIQDYTNLPSIDQEEEEKEIKSLDEEITNTSVQPVQPPKTNTVKKYTPSNNLSEPEQEVKQELKISQKGSPIIPRKNKVKTKGIPYKKTKTTVQKVSNKPILDPKGAEREDAFARIQDLSKEYPIKPFRIEKEFKKAVKFIDGKIVNQTGSKHRLTDSHFNLKYETVHGSDDITYKGNKRRWAINTLIKTYLLGLTEEQANEYLKKYKFDHIQKISHFLNYVFSNKTKA